MTLAAGVTTGGVESIEAHRFHGNIASQNHYFGSVNLVAILLINRPLGLRGDEVCLQLSKIGLLELFRTVEILPQWARFLQVLIENFEVKPNQQPVTVRLHFVSSSNSVLCGKGKLAADTLQGYR